MNASKTPKADQLRALRERAYERRAEAARASLDELQRTIAAIPALKPGKPRKKKPAAKPPRKGKRRRHAAGAEMKESIP